MGERTGEFMTDLIKKITDKEMSRRDFIKTSALVGSTFALIGGSGGLAQVANAAEADTAVSGEEKWTPAACWHNCGGRCLNKALVVDGVVVRQKTDDLKEDSDDAPQQRACLRGRSQQMQALGADRLKYPMKRKHWEPGGGNRELRGQDEWERITWNEAYDYIADEISRITGTYGSEAIMATGSVSNPLLSQIGPYVQPWRTISWGSWYAGNYLLGIGDGCMLVDQLNDRLDLQNAQLCIAFGINSAWSALGNATHFYLEMKKKGCEFIVIDPIYTDTTAVLDATWIPLRPGTDMALMFALCYTLLDEDDPKTNPLIDWEFLDSHTYGFDADHMPPDARENENFKDYLLGNYDNTPKTPEWASKICGVEPNDIRMLARRMGKDTKLALLTSWSTARTYDSDSLPQLFMTLGMMGGHFGKSGHATGVSCWNHAANFGPPLVIQGADNAIASYSQSASSIPVNDTECWPAVLGEPFNPSGVISAIHSAPQGWKDLVADTDLAKEPERIALNIQMLWHSDSANLQTSDGMAKGIEAHRKVEFVLSQNSHLTTNAKYSDIVLPVTTLWERDGSILPWSNREMIAIGCKIIEPLYEAKDDEEIVGELARRLGFKPEEMYPLTRKERFFNSMVGSTIVKEDGKSFENLLTITQDDIAEWDCGGKPQQGRVDMKQFLEDGMYQVMRHQGDSYGHIAYKDFADDPENNPLYSTTGKFEIYSQTLADVINSQGFSKISPIPKYKALSNGYESTFEDFEAGVKGAYPYQCVNVKYQRRSHSIFDHIPWLREAMCNPVYLSARDATDQGIKNGDTVLVTSEYGKTLRPAYVTERIMPGVIALPHGAWADVDEETSIDMAGADNYIVGNISTGQGVSGWNTQRVSIEKWTGEPLVHDTDVPQRILF